MIIHEFENQHHRLIDSDTDEHGEWARYEDVARLKDYGAVTHHHSHHLPSVFRIVELKPDEYKNHHLGLDSDDYWMGSREGG
jgi:hypothetical protein